MYGCSAEMELIESVAKADLSVASQSTVVDIARRKAYIPTSEPVCVALRVWDAHRKRVGARKFSQKAALSTPAHLRSARILSPFHLSLPTIQPLRRPFAISIKKQQLESTTTTKCLDERFFVPLWFWKRWEVRHTVFETEMQQVTGNLSGWEYHF